MSGSDTMRADGVPSFRQPGPRLIATHPPRQSSLPDRIRLPLRFDPAPLVADLAALARHDWTAHYVPANYQGNWDILPLRAPVGAKHPIQMIFPSPTATAFFDTPFLDAAPAFRAVLAAFRCEAQTARLMRLSAGSSILEHSDYDLDAEMGTARIHIPVETNDDVIFRLNGERVEMKPGSAWYLRLADRHSVHNGGTSDRIHLVVDFVVNDWLDAQLRAGMQPDAA